MGFFFGGGGVLLVYRSLLCRSSTVVGLGKVLVEQEGPSFADFHFYFSAHFLGFLRSSPKLSGKWSGGVKIGEEGRGGKGAAGKS